jgi:hypothetical protein
MSKKRMLADVLWEAANKHLSDGRTYWGTSFSCHAALDAVDWEDSAAHALRNFFRSLGCDPGEAYTFCSPSGHARQSARYMWLLLAMHVAEDEGIEV